MEYDVKAFPFHEAGGCNTDFICLKGISFPVISPGCQGFTCEDARPAQGCPADEAREREAGSGAGAPGGNIQTLSAPLGYPALRGPAVGEAWPVCSPDSHTRPVDITIFIS